MKWQPKLVDKTKIHLWYITGIFAFIIIELTTYIVVTNGGSENLMNFISFGSTLSSLILSILAIIFTVISNEATNRLGEGLTNMKEIPLKVEDAIKSTITDLKNASKALYEATELNHQGIADLQDAVKTQMSAFDQHIQKRLDVHENKLNDINERLLKSNTTEQHANHGNEISDDVLHRYLSTTSNYNLQLLYAIKEYLLYTNNSKVNPPINLETLSTVLNDGKKDSTLPMYLFACIVVCSSFGLLSYSNDEDLQNVVFNNIDERIPDLIDNLLRTRKATPGEHLKKYLESLFNIHTQETEEDGSKAN